MFNVRAFWIETITDTVQVPGTRTVQCQFRVAQEARNNNNLLSTHHIVILYLFASIRQADGERILHIHPKRGLEKSFSRYEI